MKMRSMNEKIGEENEDVSRMLRQMMGLEEARVRRPGLGRRSQRNSMGEV